MGVGVGKIDEQWNGGDGELEKVRGVVKESQAS